MPPKAVVVAEKISKSQQKPKKKPVSATTVLVVIMGIVLAFVGLSFFAPTDGPESSTKESYKGVC
jgi:hypothetical protein